MELTRIFFIVNAAGERLHQFGSTTYIDRAGMLLRRAQRILPSAGCRLVASLELI